MIGGAVGIAVALAGTWLLFVKPRLGPFDTSIVYGPLAGVVVTALAHAARPRVKRPRLVGAIAGALAVAAVALSLSSRAIDPKIAIEIWGDRPLAGLAVDAVYDIDAIRADISLAQFRPVDRPGAAHPDIVLITIDTVRAIHARSRGEDPEADGDDTPGDAT